MQYNRKLFPSDPSRIGKYNVDKEKIIIIEYLIQKNNTLLIWYQLNLKTSTNIKTIP